MAMIDFITNLPNEIIYHIMSFISLKDVIACRKTCKIFHVHDNNNLIEKYCYVLSFRAQIKQNIVNYLFWYFDAKNMTKKRKRLCGKNMTWLILEWEDKISSFLKKNGCVFNKNGYIYCPYNLSVSKMIENVFNYDNPYEIIKITDNIHNIHYWELQHILDSTPFVTLQKTTTELDKIFEERYLNFLGGLH